MAGKRDRTLTRKMRDKWRAKVWYTIIAPETFSSKELGVTPADDPKKVVGRIAETTLYDMTGNFKKMHVKLYFRINRIQGTNAYTRFIGHDMTADYIRRMIRRRRSRIDIIFDVKTSDGYMMRVKVLCVPDRRIKSSIESEIRKEIIRILSEKARGMVFSEYVKYLLSDGSIREISSAVKLIYPVRRIEIRKSEVLHFPEEKIIEMPQEEKEAMEEIPSEEISEPQPEIEVAPESQE